MIEKNKFLGENFTILVKNLNRLRKIKNMKLYMNTFIVYYIYNYIILV